MPLSSVVVLTLPQLPPVATMAHVVPPYVEPGRLEARVSEYYRKLEIALGGAPPQGDRNSDLRVLIFIFSFGYVYHDSFLEI